MAIAINNSYLALRAIPEMQKKLDRAAGGGRCFQIHRVCAYATILPFDFELWQQMQLETSPDSDFCLGRCLAKQEALDWQADPDDDLGELEVLHHLRQQAAVVPFLSGVISRRDHSNGATILSGSALSPSIQAKTQGRLLSSFHRHSKRESYLRLQRPKSIPNSRGSERIGIGRQNSMTPFFLHFPSDESIVWASSQVDGHLVFWQVQVDMIDLFSWRTLPTSSPGKRRRTAFNPFLQVSHSPVIEDTSRGNSLPHARRFNGVRHRSDRKNKIWVAEMKPPKHKTKQDFGNFKSEAEAAHAVDAAFHHYGRPDLFNFPHTSLQFLSTRPMAALRLDEKAKVKFVRKEAKLLVASIAATSPLHSTLTHSLQIPESPRHYSSGHFRSLSEISSPFSCSGPDDADNVLSQPQVWMLHDSICDISTTGVQTNLETLNSEQGWDWAAGSSPLAAQPNIVNPSACEFQSKWLDSFIWSPPAPTYSRSPSPSPSQHEIAYALLEQQSI